MRALPLILAAAALAGALAACSARQPQRNTVVSVRGLTVTLQGGSEKVSVKTSPRSVTASLLRRVPVTLLAPAERVTVAGTLPAGGAIVSFSVSPREVSHGTTPFIAALNQQTGQWEPLSSRYSPQNGRLAARLLADPVVAPLDWIGSKLSSLVAFMLRSEFVGTEPSPGCNDTAPNPVQIADSNSHHNVNACGHQASELGSSYVITSFKNLNSYPLDLIYPSSVTGSCGAYGKCLQPPSEDDIWVRLGALISAAGPSHQVLLPGYDQAKAIADIPADQAAQFTTALDYPAMFFGFLEAGVNVFVEIVTKLGSSKNPITAVKATEDSVKILDGASCALRIWQGKSGVLALAQAAWSCLYSAVPDILKALNLSGASMIAAAFQAATGFVSAGITSIHGLLDGLTGETDHVFTVRVSSLGSYAGQWYVHGATLQIDADGSGNMTWNAGPCSPNISVDQGMCTGHASITFKPVADGIAGTLTNVWYTAYPGPLPSDFQQPAEPAAGESFTLKFTSREVLYTTYTDPVVNEGNRNWCRAGYVDPQVCGA